MQFEVFKSLNKLQNCKLRVDLNADGGRSKKLLARYLHEFAITVKIHVCHLPSVFPIRILLKLLINPHFLTKDTITIKEL